MTIHEALDFLIKARAEVAIIPLGGNVKGGDYEIHVAFPDAGEPHKYQIPGEMDDGGLAEVLIEAAERWA